MPRKKGLAVVIMEPYEAANWQKHARRNPALGTKQARAGRADWAFAGK